MDQNLLLFFMYGLIALAQLLAAAILALLVYWFEHYLEGYEWKTKSTRKFNYHPLFMVLGLVILYGDAILLYRLGRSAKKIYMKIAHMILQLAALVFSIIGVVAVFSFHNDFNYQNMYSLHSWVGLATVIMFGLQFLIGFVFYLLPVVSDRYKAAFMAFHRYWGVAIFAMAIASSLIGVTEKASSSILDYQQRSKEAYIANFLGACIMLYGWVVTFVVTKEEFKRPAESSHSILN